MLPPSKLYRNALNISLTRSCLLHHCRLVATQADEPVKRKFYKAPPSGSSTILGSAPPRRVQLELDSYQNARLLYKRGKLQSKNNQSGSADYSHYILGGVGVVFLAGFVTTPSLGRKMARDDEFRQKWVPSWYDLTVQKPEFAWTRKELHEHAVAAEKELHERAIRGISLQGIFVSCRSDWTALIIIPSRVKLWNRSRTHQ